MSCTLDGSHDDQVRHHIPDTWVCPSHQPEPAYRKPLCLQKYEIVLKQVFTYTDSNYDKALIYHPKAITSTYISSLMAKHIKGEHCTYTTESHEGGPCFDSCCIFSKLWILICCFRSLAELSLDTRLYRDSIRSVKGQYPSSPTFGICKPKQSNIYLFS